MYAGYILFDISIEYIQTQEEAQAPKPWVQAWVKPPLVQILVVVANIQTLFIVNKIISQRENDLLYPLPISSNLYMEWTMDKSDVGNNLQMMKLNFVLVRFMSLNSDITLKINRG